MLVWKGKTPWGLKRPAEWLLFIPFQSHPQGDATPSRRDRDWLRFPSLMVIQGADLRLRAWWLEPETALCTALVKDTDGSDLPLRSV